MLLSKGQTTPPCGVPRSVGNSRPFRLRARVGLSIPSPLPRPARNYPHFWIQRSSSERRRDLNPPDLRAAQRTLRSSPPLVVGGGEKGYQFGGRKGTSGGVTL